MYIREILVFLDMAPASDRRLRLAASLAAGQEAELSAVFVDDDQSAGLARAPMLPAWGMITPWIPGATAVQPSAAAAERSERHFRECLSSFGINGDWHYTDRRNFSRLISLAQNADLLVVGQIDPYTRSASRWRPNDTVAGSGRPALVVPYAGEFPRVGHRVLVAWNGSARVARALHDAFPIIRNAHAVIVLTVPDSEKGLEQGREATTRVIRHLGRHGIAARADHPLRGTSSIADVLLSAAMDRSIDLIIAGGCYHSPMHEALTGGVGRQLLQTMTVPLLTSQ